MICERCYATVGMEHYEKHVEWHTNLREILHRITRLLEESTGGTWPISDALSKAGDLLE